MPRQIVAESGVAATAHLDDGALFAYAVSCVAGSTVVDLEGVAFSAMMNRIAFWTRIEE